MLKRRLPRLDCAEHFRYVELECERIVETLREVRDQYRTYLESEGCKPIAEMYWVVFRFAMVKSAVELFCTIASAYVVDSNVEVENWRKLYDYCFAVTVPLGRGSTLPVEVNWKESVLNTMSGLVSEDTLREVMNGGPFGREGQVLLGRLRPSVEFQREQMTLVDTIKLRQELWDQCQPWTEGLARLYDTTQEELFCQYADLSVAARRAETRFLSLSDFEKIAYSGLRDMRRKSVNPRDLGTDAWLTLLCELDKQQVSLDAELHGRARGVLNGVRRKGHSVDTWEQCYNAKLHASLESGKTFSLRREVTHAIHNAAKRAEYGLSKIWSPDTTTD